MEDDYSNERIHEDDGKYTIAGCLAIASGALLLPYTILSIAVDVNHSTVPVLMPIIVLIAIVQMTFSIFAFIQFRNLLNERYGFHDIDNLVPVIVIGGILITFISILGKSYHVLRIPALVLLIIFAIPVSIAGIMYGIRLLRLKAKLHGLLRPLAYTHIIGNIFFLTLILGFLGLLTIAAFDIMLGIMFLQGREEDDAVDFV